MLAGIRRRVFTGVAIALLSTFFAAAAPAASKNVMEVVITGNDHISTEAILGSVGLKPGMEATEEALEKDKAAIAALGYFSEVTALTEDVAGGVKVIYDVVENPRISGVKVEGTGPITEKEILDLFRTRAGDVLNSKTLDRDIETIRRHYRDKGYLADVEDVSLDRETGLLTIPVVVNVVQAVDIVGNKKTPDYVFLREMKTKTGQYFNSQQLKKDLFKIYDLDILDRENPQEPRIEPGSEIGKVIVTIPVKEKKTGQISVGLGYSSRQKIVGRAELTEINFRGRGQGVNLIWEVGGTDRGSSFELGFMEPWLDRKHTSMNVSVFNKLVYRFTRNAFSGGSTLDSDYNERRKGGSLGFARPTSDTNKISLAFRGSSVNVKVPDDDLKNQNSDLPVLSEDGNLYSVTLGWSTNTRDFDLDPGTGSYRNLTVEVGSGTRSGYRKFDTVKNLWVREDLGKGVFAKNVIELRRYFSRGGPKVNITDKRRTIAVRLMFGLETGTILFSEQFFVGGAETVRGYREDRFWGTKMLVANVEYRVPIANSLTGVLFADCGDAWGSEQIKFKKPPFNELQQHTTFNPVVGAGVGIRVTTPIGNLRLDYGVGDEGSRTHFSIGHAF